MTPVPENPERSVRELLSEITLNEDCLHHSSDAPLETIGIDSVGMIELVYALENRFSIQIRDDEVAPENFASIGSLAALVARKCLS
jgi:acyl carrier protein